MPASARSGCARTGRSIFYPLADGLTNQLAAQRALASGMTAAGVFELVRRLRAEFPEAPIVFYTYYNLVFSNGSAAYVQAAKEAGVDAMLTLDLPPEEAAELSALAREAGLKTVFIVAPTTPDARIPIITAAATGFIYYVSREGVTGGAEAPPWPANIPEAVARIKARTALPVVVGFGNSDPRPRAKCGGACGWSGRGVSFGELHSGQSGQCPRHVGAAGRGDHRSGRGIDAGLSMEAGATLREPQGTVSSPILHGNAPPSVDRR